MRKAIRLLAAALLAAAVLPAAAAQRSTKRGIGFDESQVSVNAHHHALMSEGVSWFYNWGQAPKNPTLCSAENMSFVPMCWNGGFNETAVRTFLASHPETKYLLGFNEPNFSAQANMTPQQASSQWARVKKVAQDYGLTLVAPALNFTGESVGGRIWSPYEWLDEFFRLTPDSGIDCLALHCYMNYDVALGWFATEYFYKDLYDSSKTDVYNRYPNLKKYLDDYKAAHGHFPRMMLTEFCAWEYDGSITPDFQIDQMTRKVQLLEQSDLVERYAWFMANDRAASFPYMSLLETNSADSDLSTLGKVYVHMSSFDTSRFYRPGEIVDAKDYIDSYEVKLRPNSESGSVQPLEVHLGPGAYPWYQIDVPVQGDYTFTLHLKATKATTLNIKPANISGAQLSVPATNSWIDLEVTIKNLRAGQRKLYIQNLADNDPDNVVTISRWSYSRKNNYTGKSGLSGIYKIRNRNSGKYLDLDNNSTANNTAIIQWEDEGTDMSQQWELREVRPGIYAVLAASDNAKGFDVVDASTDHGVQVQLYEYLGNPHQEFILFEIDGHYEFIASHCDLVVEMPGSSTENGDWIKTWEKNDSYTQQWSLERNTYHNAPAVTFYSDIDFGGAKATLGEGSYTLKEMSLYGLQNDDISSIKVNPGFKVIVYKDDNFGGDSKTFTADASFVGNDWNDQISSIKVEANGRTGMSGLWKIRNRNSGKYIDLEDNKTSNNTPVLQYEDEGFDDGQQWELREERPGVYAVLAASNTGAGFDIENNSTEFGTRVQLYEYFGNSNQQFVLYEKDGYYSFIDTHSGLVIEVPQSSLNNGEWLRTWEANGTATQQWSLAHIEDSGIDNLNTTDSDNLLIYDSTTANIVAKLMADDTLKIYTTAGALLYEQAVKAGTTIIDINHLGAGIYIARIKGAVVKIVKQ